jgi:hypothetical protein
LKVPVRKRKGEAGQAALLVILALGIFLIGAVGLAIDGSHLYAERQMAQAAADAAAQAGIMSIFDGSNASGAHGFSTGSGFTCGTSDQKTPCYYAQTLNGFGGASDTVAVDFPTAAAVGVPTSSLSTTDPVNLLRVTIQRTVNTTFIALLGPSAETIKASGTAAIVSVMSPVPILVTHPKLPGSFSLQGSGSTAKIKICGGPSRSVQVNSSNSGAMSWTGNPSVDLSHAGPNDPGNCTTGTGADFGDFGGPSGGGSIVSLGTSGHFISPASPILDPLANVSPPANPGGSQPATSTITSSATTRYGCPTGISCTVYSPGLYTSDIKVKNDTALFKPGIYYMSGANFTAAANGNMMMATGYTDTGAGTTNTGWAGNMLIYMTGTTAGSCNNPTTTGTISISANSTVSLMGSPSGSAYQGILFFVDRWAASATHSLDGGGGLTLVGTLYATDYLSMMGPTCGGSTYGQYQTVHFQGNAGSSTLITGEIITSVLELAGTPGIVMDLNGNPIYNVRQVALVK